MSYKNYITKVIELQDANLVIYEVITKDNTKTIKVSKPRELSNKSCIHCGSLNIKTHAYHIRKIKFLDIASYKSKIEYKQRRFKCNDCNQTFNESTDLVEKGSTISNQAKVKLLERLKLFSNHLQEEISKVKYIATDLFEPYRTICKNIFWRSFHIADRFHWIRLATEGFNKIRIRIMNAYLKLGKESFKGSYNKYTKYANVLKKYHKLLLANTYSKEKWFFDQKRVASYIKQEMTLQEIIEYCINFDGDLEVSYLLLQELYKIAKFSNYDNARENIIKWCVEVEKTTPQK